MPTEPQSTTIHSTWVVPVRREYPGNDLEDLSITREHYTGQDADSVIYTIVGSINGRMVLKLTEAQWEALYLFMRGDDE